MFDNGPTEQSAAIGQLGGLRGVVRLPTYTERVAHAVEQAEQQLADLKRMQEIFAKHPEFEELLTLVQRGRL